MEHHLNHYHNYMHSLYGGAVRITKTHSGVRYKIEVEGKKMLKVPSVTGVLGVIAKPALIPWAVNLACDHLLEIGSGITADDIETARKKHNVRKTDAGEIGSQVHAWVENFLKTGDKSIPEHPQVQNGIKAFLRWVKEYNVQFFSSERVVYSRKYNYVGTMDAEAIVGGKKCVIDFKTSSGIHPEMFLQTAAYQYAAMEEGTTYNGDRYIVRFAKIDEVDKKTGEILLPAGMFQVKKCGAFKKDLKGFLAALQLKRRLEEINDYKT